MDRAERAKAFHKQGFNCAQSVAMAFADYYGVNEKTMAKISCAFGRGIGKQELTCGAVLAMCMLIGLEEGNDTSDQKDKRQKCYQITQILCNEFKQQYGSMECKDIIGIVPCSEKVHLAAKLFDDYLRSKK